MIALLIAASTAGCSRGPARPQTTDEFRAEVLAHRHVRIERWVVEDSFGAVSDRLRHAFMSCFERVYTSCDHTGHCSREIYTPRAVEDAPARRAVGVQLKINAFGAYRHGAYRMLVDVEPRGESATLVTFHGFMYQYYDRFLVAAHRWSAEVEEPLECPQVQFALGAGDFRRSTMPPFPPVEAAPSVQVVDAATEAAAQ